jgi:uridine kinase
MPQSRFMHDALASTVKHQPEQHHTSWDLAQPTLRQLIDQAEADKGHSLAVVVGITGPVGSGKTSLAKRLGGVLLSTDHYLPYYDTLPEPERDEPRHADLALLAAHLESLGRREPVKRPEWCFQTHRRAGTREVTPGPVVVCEGIFALRREVRHLLDIAVYVDAPATVRWSRWEQIEASGERGWGVERARRYFATVAEPTFARYAEEYRAEADVIVRNDG